MFIASGCKSSAEETVVTVVFVLWTGTALAQGKPACDAKGKTMAPGTV